MIKSKLVNNNDGFVLALSLFAILGVTAIAVGTVYNNRMSHTSALNYKHKLQTYLASDGMMTLLAQEIINNSVDKYIDTTLVGQIEGREYTGIPGNDVAILKTAMNNPTAPFINISSNYLGSSIKGKDYGIVWSGWIIPPVTGQYKFYVRSNRASEFYLSTDESENNLSADPICQETYLRMKWPAIGSTSAAVSSSIFMQQNKKYFFKYFHKQGGLTGLGQVGWDGPDGFSERPISGQFITNQGGNPNQAKVAKVGGLKVRYRVDGNSLAQYQIFTEAVELGLQNPTDTVFRAPLNQRISLLQPQPAPDSTLTIRAIFYDYPSADGSDSAFPTHTEFNAPDTKVTSGNILGMVKDTLTNFTVKDAWYFNRAQIPKVTKNNNALNRNCSINTWFQEYTTGDTAYTYDWDKPADYCGKFNTTDARPRTRYYDSLVFTLDQSQGPGTYVYSRLGNEWTGNPETEWQGEPLQFFPLDKYGIDPPGNPWNHNFSFCMEIHSQFQYQLGLNFQFTGDDDVWVYVNNKLVIDLGGLHAATPSSVQFDDIPNLKLGKIYPLDFFQCERHPTQSASRIVTNIIQPLVLGRPTVSWKRDYGNLE